jgi:hypothetical protein
VFRGRLALPARRVQQALRGHRELPARSVLLVLLERPAPREFKDSLARPAPLVLLEQ